MHESNPPPTHKKKKKRWGGGQKLSIKKMIRDLARLLRQNIGYFI